MTQYKYIPVDYFTYNSPDYVAALITLILFFIFFVVLYWVFKYENYNRRGLCDPMFYYGEACRNTQSRQILLDPKFLTMKQSYYNRVAKYNEETRKYEGVRERTAVDKDIVGQAQTNMQDNLDSNVAFGKENIDELNQISSVAQLIASKYLGNIGSLLKNAPSELLKNMREMPEQIGELKNLIQATIVDPMFASQTAPLQKLYRALTEIDKKTILPVSPGIAR
jgi:hypothetical protein